MVTNRFPVINLGALPPRSRLGQGTTNRLTGLPVPLILDRYQLAIEELNQEHVRLTGSIYYDTDFPSGYDPEDVETLRAIRANPSPEELQDLSLITSILALPPERSPYYYEPNIVTGLNYGSPGGKIPTGVCQPNMWPKWTIGSVSIHPEPFLCPPAGRVLLPRGIPYDWPPHDHLTYLGLSDVHDAPWGEYKTEVRNAAIIFEALNGYPFPNPIPILPSAWYANPDVRVGLQSLVHEPLPQDDKSAITLVRMWITMMTVQTYNWVAGVIADEIESELEHEFRRELVKQAFIAAGLAILTAGLGAAIALVVPTVTLPGGIAVSTASAVEAFSAAVQSYYTKQEQAKAAEELDAIAATFRPDNPEFANEVQNVADTFKYLSGTVGTAWGLTQDELDAIEAAKRKGEISPATHGTYDTPVHELQKPSPLVPLGIGALTAGALYFLL